MKVKELEEMLTRLRLTAVRDQLENLLEEAGRKKFNLREAVAYLCEVEIAHKEEKRMRMGTSIAKFPFHRTLEGFEFEAQPSLDRGLIRELATCRWVGNGDNLLFLGPPGVGKTHLSVGLGRKAIAEGYTTLFTSATSLLTQLSAAYRERRLEDRLLYYSKPKLLIIDELGYLPFEANSAHLFFQLVCRRYEKGSVLVTSNRPVGEWGEIFGDAVIATAILDRLLHHSQVVTIKGDSYRLQEKRRSGLIRSTAKESKNLN